MSSTQGRLLVAAPPLNDPNFERAVVLMLTHDAEGAFGLVISRPTEVDSVGEDASLDGWMTHTSTPSVFFEGGPVQQNSIIGLARFSDDQERSWTSDVGNGLHTVDLNSDATNARECSALRLFVGYSGWGSAQLDGELAEEHWYVLDAHGNDAFDSEPETLWRRVLERDPVHRSWVRTFPDDPNLN
jgi:putative transcriptional regulator